MRYPTVFNMLADIFKKGGVRCVLIGGFAVNNYNVTRQTIDIDFLCIKEDFDKVFSLLEKEGYKKIDERESFTRLKSSIPYVMDIDFMFVDKGTFNKVFNDGQKVNIAGEEFIVPSIMHLIALKIHSIKNNSARMYKDFIDIIDLIKKNGINAKEPEFKTVCLKYGTEELYEKIMQFI